MIITKVEIYPSQFGIEQMKKDALYGPSKEIFDAEAKQPEKKKTEAAAVLDDEDFRDDDDFKADGFNAVQLRKYELQKMKYFYAVIHCNSKKTAERIYNENNGFEFELSNIRLQLSFVADSLTFPQKPKEIATEIPVDYEFRASNSLSRALNHTHVKLTWDQTDPKRQQKFQKIMAQDDADEEAYKEFLASASEDEEEEMDRDKVEEYRQKLLGALSDAKGGDISEVFRQRDHQQEGKDEDIDIKFTSGFGEDLGKKIIKEKKEKKELEGETAWEKFQRKKKEKKKEKKQKAKEAKEAKKKMSSNPEDEDEVKRRRAELEMLVGKKRNGLDAEFKADTSDQRFSAILKNKDFAIDPTHKNFKKVADGEFVKEQKIKRRKMHENE